MLRSDIILWKDPVFARVRSVAPNTPPFRNRAHRWVSPGLGYGTDFGPSGTPLVSAELVTALLNHHASLK